MLLDDRSLELLAEGEAVGGGRSVSGGMSLAEVLDVLLTAPRHAWKDLFLTVSEAAYLADVDAHMVRRWLGEGRIRGYRDRGQYFVLAESLRSFLDP